MDGVSADLDALRAAGIDVVTIDWDEVKGQLHIGVSSSVDAARPELQRRHGTDILVDRQEPATFS